MSNFKQSKVITIGIVSELTGLSERQIRYYEERKLVYPERSKGGTRKYSFEDIEILVEVGKKIGDGHRTYEIRKSKEKEQRMISKEELMEKMLKGQLNARFNNQQYTHGKEPGKR